MKKKLVIVLSCALAATLLFGCTSKEPTTTEGETQQQETTTETTAADGELTAEQFQTLYDGAFAIYKQIVLEGFEMSTTDVIDVDGYTYNRVTDERFSDMEAFRTYLGQYFTQNMMDTDIFAENNIRFTEGKGGGLYVLDGARGTNIFYAGYVMGEPVKTETGMSVTATAYYTKDGNPYEGETFTEAPADPSQYETTDYTFNLVQEDGQWKFDTFHLFY